MEDLNTTINQFDLTDIYRTLHQQLKNIIFKCTWNINYDKTIC